MNIEVIEQIVALINEHPVSEITVEQDGGRVHVRKSLTSVRPAAAAPVTEMAPSETPSEAEQLAAEAEVLAEPEPIVLMAPMVGLFHHLSPPIPYGGLVTPQQNVGSIESMKLMNDVKAEQGGRVVEVLIEDGAPVEYGQPLFRLIAA